MNALQLPAFQRAVLVSARRAVWRQRRHDDDRLDDDLVDAAVAAIDEYLGRHAAQLPDLLADFVDGELSKPMRAELAAATRDAIRDRQQMRRQVLVRPRPYPPNRCPVLTAATINRRIDSLLAQVRRIGTRGGTNARCAAAHAQRLERYRTRWLAALGAS